MFFGTTENLSVSGDSYDIGRLHIESVNPITMGYVGLSLLLLSTWPILMRVKNLTSGKKLLAFAGAALGLYLIVAAASRGPVVTLFVVMCFYLLSVNLKKTWKPIVLALVFLTIGYNMAVHLEEAGRFRMISRIENAFSGDDIAVRDRQTAYTGAWQQFLDSPIVGDALEEKVTRFYPHNVILESLMATGVVGGVPFLVMFTLGIGCAYRLLKWRAINGWVALIFIQYFTAAQFSGAIYSSTIMWTFLAATIALYYGTKTEAVKNPQAVWEGQEIRKVRYV